MSIHWSPSKYLIQCAPPDMAEGGARWAFAIYEIIDKRKSPIDPRVCHAVYSGVVELDAEEIGDPKDPLFSVKLQEAVVNRWKKER